MSKMAAHTHTHMAQCNEFAKVSTNNSAMMNRVQRGSGGGGGGDGEEKEEKTLNNCT